MVFWSDTTDRKSPVPSEAINISHLPRQSGQGRGRCQEGNRIVTRPEPAKAMRGQSFCRAAGRGGQAGTEDNSGGRVWSGGRGIVPQNKESAMASAPQLPAHLHPPEREAWRARRAGHAGAESVGTEHPPALPPRPTDVYAVSRGNISMPTLPTTNTHPHPLRCS